jgi:hypothetical protein
MLKTSVYLEYKQRLCKYDFLDNLLETSPKPFIIPKVSIRKSLTEKQLFNNIKKDLETIVNRTSAT